MKGILRFFALPLILIAFGISLNGCGGGSSSIVLPVVPGTPSSVSAIPGDSRGNRRLECSYWRILVQYLLCNNPWRNEKHGNKDRKSNQPIRNHRLEANGTTYYIVVTAVNAFGESSESTEVYSNTDSDSRKTDGSICNPR